MLTALSSGKIGGCQTGEPDHDPQEQIAHIERSIEETRKFCVEQHARMATWEHKPDPAPWPILLAGMVVGAALFGAGIAFMKLQGVVTVVRLRDCLGFLGRAMLVACRS